MLPKFNSCSATCWKVSPKTVATKMEDIARRRSERKVWITNILYRALPTAATDRTKITHTKHHNSVEPAYKQSHCHREAAYRGLIHLHSSFSTSQHSGTLCSGLTDSIQCMKLLLLDTEYATLLKAGSCLEMWCMHAACRGGDRKGRGYH